MIDFYFSGINNDCSFLFMCPLPATKKKLIQNNFLLKKNQIVLNNFLNNCIVRIFFLNFKFLELNKNLSAFHLHEQ